jgi:hypothetical protein
MSQGSEGHVRFRSAGRQPALSGDSAYDGSGSNNCFADNVYKTDDPPGIVSLFPCP